MLKKLLPALIVSLIVLAASWSLLSPQFFRVHDYVHAARVAEMSRALADGHIIPRWSQNFGFGYGMPLFEFYAPLPYFIGALLYMSGIPMIIVLKLLFFMTNLLVACGSYLLGKSLFNKHVGLLMAAMLTLAPYRALNLFVRGALSESWGIMAMPWILYGVVLIFSGKKSGSVITVISLSALLLSHNLMSMIFLPSIALFSLALAAYHLVVKNLPANETLTTKLQSIYKPVMDLLLSGLLAVGLTAFYTVPALVEKDLTKVKEAVTGGYFDYHLHFLYLRQFVTDNWGYGGSGWGPQDDISFFLGWPQLVMILISLSLVALKLFSSLRTKQLSQLVKKCIFFVVLFSGLVLINIVMTTEKTAPLWSSVEFFSYIQFPWRWLGSAVVWVALLASLAVFAVSDTRFKRIFTGVFLLVSLVNAQYFRPAEYLQDFNSFYYTDEQKISKQMSSILYDYMPTAVPITISPPQNAIDCNSQVTDFKQECSNTEVIEKKTHQLLLKTAFENDTKIILSIADFPGWKVELDGEIIKHQVNENGLLELTVPKGTHLVGATFASTPVRSVSDAVTLLSAFIFLVVVFAKYKAFDLEKQVKPTSTL